MTLFGCLTYSNDQDRFKFYCSCFQTVNVFRLWGRCCEKVNFCYVTCYINCSSPYKVLIHFLHFLLVFFILQRRYIKKYTTLSNYLHVEYRPLSRSVSWRGLANGQLHPRQLPQGKRVYDFSGNKKDFISYQHTGKRVRYVELAALDWDLCEKRRRRTEVILVALMKTESKTEKAHSSEQNPGDRQIAAQESPVNLSQHVSLLAAEAEGETCLSLSRSSEPWTQSSPPYPGTKTHS